MNTILFTIGDYNYSRNYSVLEYHKYNDTLAKYNPDMKCSRHSYPFIVDNAISRTERYTELRRLAGYYHKMFGVTLQQGYDTKWLITENDGYRANFKSIMLAENFDLLNTTTDYVSSSEYKIEYNEKLHTARLKSIKAQQHQLKVKENRLARKKKKHLENVEREHGGTYTLHEGILGLMKWYPVGNTTLKRELFAHTIMTTFTDASCTVGELTERMNKKVVVPLTRTRKKLTMVNNISISGFITRDLGWVKFDCNVEDINDETVLTACDIEDIIEKLRRYIPDNVKSFEIVDVIRPKRDLKSYGIFITAHYRVSAELLSDKYGGAAKKHIAERNNASETTVNQNLFRYARYLASKHDYQRSETIGRFADRAAAMKLLSFVITSKAFKGYHYIQKVTKMIDKNGKVLGYKDYSLLETCDLGSGRFEVRFEVRKKLFNHFCTTSMRIAKRTYITPDGIRVVVMPVLYTVMKKLKIEYEITSTNHKMCNNASKLLKNKEFQEDLRNL